MIVIVKHNNKAEILCLNSEEEEKQLTKIINTIMKSSIKIISTNKEELTLTKSEIDFAFVFPDERNFDYEKFINLKN